MTDETPHAANGRQPSSREARAEAKAAKAREKAMRPWYRKKRFVLPLLLVVIVIIAAVAGSSTDDETDVATGGGDGAETNEPRTLSGNTENPPAADVEVTECHADDVLGHMAALRITNHSSKASNYVVEVSFESEDGTEQFGTGTAFVNGLEPNQTRSEEVSSLDDADQPFTCRITEVDRFAA